MENSKNSGNIALHQAAIRLWSMMNEHRATFYVARLLRNAGISRTINKALTCVSDRKLRKHPSGAMQASRRYYQENQARINDLLPVFADKKSKMVMGGGDRLPC